MSPLLGFLPLRFGTVSGDFFCTDSFLCTLEGCPVSVGGDFLVGELSEEVKVKLKVNKI